jgi:hypothetical protein
MPASIERQQPQPAVLLERLSCRGAGTPLATIPLIAALASLSVCFFARAPLRPLCCFHGLVVLDLCVANLDWERRWHLGVSKAILIAHGRSARCSVGVRRLGRSTGRDGKIVYTTKVRWLWLRARMRLLHPSRPCPLSSPSAKHRHICVVRQGGPPSRRHRCPWAAGSPAALRSRSASSWTGAGCLSICRRRRLVSGTNMLMVSPSAMHPLARSRLRGRKMVSQLFSTTYRGDMYRSDINVLQVLIHRRYPLVEQHLVGLGSLVGVLGPTICRV